MSKVLVTGGCGYIGSHTVLDLIENKFEVISVDNLSRGTAKYLEGIKKITGKDVKNHAVDLCDLEKVREIFKSNAGITGVIHFAVHESGIVRHASGPDIIGVTDVRPINGVPHFNQLARAANHMSGANITLLPG